MRNRIAVVIFCWLIAGCAPKETFVLLPDPDGEVGNIVVSNVHGSQTLDTAQQAVTVRSKADSPSEAGTMKEKEIRRLFGKAMDAQPSPPVKYIFYFAADSSRPTSAPAAEISKILKTIKERESMDISIDGHTDLVGEDAYNENLSLQRAEYIQSLLVKNGVDLNHTTTTSYGKNRPLVPTADNVPESRNRRVEVIIR